jgi:small subunit ribosomal protein S4
MRLENIVFRFGFSKTIPGARQLVNHGHITVNGKRVNIPSFQCKSNDVIGVMNKSQSKTLVKDSLEVANYGMIPAHLELDKDKLVGKINSVVAREDVNLDINELFIVEFYSRK